jgi:hypothetical protein
MPERRLFRHARHERATQEPLVYASRLVQVDRAARRSGADMLESCTDLGGVVTEEADYFDQRFAPFAISGRNRTRRGTAQVGRPAQRH